MVGEDAEMKACADAAKTVFDEVERHWRTSGAGGKALYEYAAERAETLGWRLNLDIKGHRVSDFPHAIYKAGKLGDFDSCPTPGYGYSKYNSRIRRGHSARFTKICSYEYF